MSIINLNETSTKEDLGDSEDFKAFHGQVKPSESGTMLQMDVSRRSESVANDQQLFEHVTSLGQLELMRKYAPCHPMPQLDDSRLNISENENSTQQTENRNIMIMKNSFKTNDEDIYGSTAAVSTSSSKHSYSPTFQDTSFTKIKDEDSIESQNGLPSASIIPLKKTVKAGSNQRETVGENQTGDSLSYQVVRVPSSDDDDDDDEGIDSDSEADYIKEESEIKDERMSDVDYEPGFSEDDTDEKHTQSKRKRKRSGGQGQQKRPASRRQSPRIRKEEAKRPSSYRGRRTVAKLALKIKMKQLSKTKVKVKKTITKIKKEESDEVKEKRKQLESSIDEANLACLLCNKTFDTKRAFRRHTNRHWSNFQCDQCGKNFSSIDSLSHHQRGLHSNIKPYSCEECGQFFNFHHSYKLHMRKHRGERPYQCDLCDKSYLTGTHLKAHKQAIHHSGDKHKFTCNVCNKEFNYNNSLKTHMMIHLNERPHKCSMCSKGFVTRQALKAHEESYHVSEKNYQCDICLKFYKSEHLRNVHRRRHTDDVNRFMCDICGRQFMFKSNLDAHVFVHMDARPFSCKLCGKTFKCMSSLYTHQYTHKSDTPFQCRVCAKTFKTKNCCKAHEKRHNPEKTFVCHTCGSCFPDKGGLSKHIRTIHAPARQFVCKFCGKTGTRADNMRTHVKSHGKDLTPEELQNCISEVSITDSTEEGISTQMTINSALTYNPISKLKPLGRKCVPQTIPSTSAHSPLSAHHQLQSPVAEGMSEPAAQVTEIIHHDMAMMRQAAADMVPSSHPQTHTVAPSGLVPLHLVPMSRSPNPIQQSMGLANQTHMQYSGTAAEHDPGSVQHAHIMSPHEHRHLLMGDGSQYL
ncbi:zinc finger protein 37 homolog [Gigantopelta aegis]|uniref:zinc finger protein 37 homolog n=1 Tax=Gigantopelta aegis TaxID=1735272 RepID=UPI001B88C091|nr:zinc finger protein 37 homolog [Gigantopelta aegis]